MSSIAERARQPVGFAFYGKPNLPEQVAPLLATMPEKERLPKAKFLEHLLTNVERGDQLTAAVVQAVDGYACEYCENGPYGPGGSVETTAGYALCQQQFKGLYAIFEAGRQSIS